MKRTYEGFKIRKKITYTQLIALGFLVVILIGTALLCLPAASRNGQSTGVLDAAFTATSATCVTGLSVFDTYTHWSLFGQIVILLLIQVGGLGFMTVITMFSIFMRRRIGLHERRLLMQAAGTMRHSGVIRLIKRVLTGTLVFELAGMLLLSLRFVPQMGARGLWYALFHSVSAFCNAGFDLMGRFGQSSFTAYSGDPLVCLTLMSLTVIGGIGFLVWSDLIHLKLNFKKYQLHTKIVLCMTVLLLVAGGVAVYLTERDGAFSSMTEGEKWLSALFQSVTTRTAGFATVDQTSLSDSGSIVSMVLMFIGGSPGSTAGGLKTTTFAVLLAAIFSCARNESSTVVFKRQIDPATIRQASAISGIYLSAVLVASAVICAIEPAGIREVFYEVISAIGTVGLSMSLTPLLSGVSRAILIFLMYAGRIGGLSLVLALAEKRSGSTVERPVEKILIG